MDLNLIFIVVVAFVLLVVIKAAMRKRTFRDHRYQLREPFLSPAERSFYGVISTAVSNDYVVLAKVRVADVIAPETGQDRSNWQTAFNRISAKHFDFVLCDPKTLSIEHVVELHDRSHQSATRAKRDDLLRKACESAGLPLSEFVAKKAYSIDEIRNKILQFQSLGEAKDGRIEPVFKASN